MASLTQEAERVQKHNAELQADAKKQATDAHALTQLREEIAAFQKANDSLEADLLKRDRHTASLQEQVRAGHARIQLLQRQLALSHHARTRQLRPARVPGDALADDAGSGRGGRGGGGGAARRKLPLLWDADSSPSGGVGGGGGADGTGGGGSADGATERTYLPSQPPTLPGRMPPAAAGSPPRPTAQGGALTQRAVELFDDVASEPLVITRVAPHEPLLAQPFHPDACRALRLRDNSRELAAAQAWKEAEAFHAVQLTSELRRQADGDAQELRVVRATLVSRTLNARVAKLGVLKHYRMLGIQRALCKWALLLEVDYSYQAALDQAANLFEEQASTLRDEIGQTQERTVQTLLIEPSMLSELGEMRRKLQHVHAEAETLRCGLRRLCDSRSKTAQVRPLSPGDALSHPADTPPIEPSPLSANSPVPPARRGVAAISDGQAAWT